MKIQTKLANHIDVIDNNKDIKWEQDNACKKVLSNKQILAWIMKGTLDEYKDYTVDEIATKYIEGSPQTGIMAVHQDEDTHPEGMWQDVHTHPEEIRPEDITGMNNESVSLLEGKTTYDVRFHAIVPSSGENVKLILNVEAQNNYYPGYPIQKRGIYYCGRMLSAQYGTEFTSGHYEDVKKVFSIWICVNPPKSREHTANRYVIREEQLLGSVSEEKKNYDLLELVIICLGNRQNESDTDSELENSMKLLETIFTSELAAEDKKKNLEEKFGIAMTKELDEEVEKMCNYSEYIEERGIQKGLAQGIEQGIERGKIQLIENMHESGMSIEEIARVAKMSPGEVKEMLGK